MTRQRTIEPAFSARLDPLPDSLFVYAYPARYAGIRLADVPLEGLWVPDLFRYPVVEVVETVHRSHESDISLKHVRKTDNM